MSKIEPRLIRPEKDGEIGEWSYLFKNDGVEYIFPAKVGELGRMKMSGQGIVGKSMEITADEAAWVKKIIYWRASEWETKMLPKAVEWISKNGFTFPKIPWHIMELRKIEDRDSEDRVTEAIEYIAMPSHLMESGVNRPDSLLIEQYREVPGEQGPGKKPLMQLWADGFIDFGNKNINDSMFSVSNACETIPEWGKHPEFLKSLIDKDGADYIFKLLRLRKRRKKEVAEETLRLATIWIAFCCYITSLKVTYEDGLPQKGVRRKQEKILEEAVAIEQAEIFEKVSVLKSGTQKRPVATGTGTQHGYRYVVRGHERIINGRAIWIKPHIRGEGELVVKAVGTEEVGTTVAAMKDVVKEVRSVRDSFAQETLSLTKKAMSLVHKFFNLFRR